MLKEKELKLTIAKLYLNITACIRDYQQDLIDNDVEGAEKEIEILTPYIQEWRAIQTFTKEYIEEGLLFELVDNMKYAIESLKIEDMPKSFYENNLKNEIHFMKYHY